MSDPQDLITVVLVENNPQLSKHLQKTLGLIEEIDLVNISMSAQEAVEAIRDLKPDVALVEYDLPDMNGITLTEMLRRDFPGTKWFSSHKTTILIWYYGRFERGRVILSPMMFRLRNLPMF